MSSSASEGRATEGGRLGGARADFVGSLGRKIADARDLLSALEDDPSSKLVRDELRRRLHALGAGARLLKLESMARTLQEALVVLERAADVGSLRETEVALLGQTLDDLPALAWGESVLREPRPAPGETADEAPTQTPITVLVVGGEALADALMEEGVARTRAFECERTEDLESAVQLARAYAPDLLVVDADLPRAPEVVESLLDDPLTEPVPIIVVGSFRVADDAARFVALGVAKALAKPVTPEVLRATCDEILAARSERTVRVTLGEPTLEQLADRLSDEIRRALVEGVDPAARAYRVPLGEGTEVLGALWGAIARVQEIVSQKTQGAVRFGGGAPEGTVALAPWLPHHDLPGADRTAGRGRGAAADVRLNGRRIVVADDDPGVTWFISDLLRTAGCEVHEALDGSSALDLAFRVQPDLVVSDILMPGLDGFALSRALRRDVALRDTPVILLSWKEDLLQRVRELGASAAAYMRKESDSRAVLARVREVLRPRARIEMRLRGDGEVRGRLDGLSPRLLLELVSVIRRDARIAMRDAMFLYEIEVRGGAPRKITRTASDGSYQSGERALASLLGVGAGRFVVASTTEPVRGELTGSLFDQLARPIASARAALACTTGAATVHVEQLAIDQTIVDEYLRATPEPARALVQRLAQGASPRELLLGGQTAPALLEDVLADLAARGAVRAVLGADRSDMLPAAVEDALAVIRGSTRSGTLPPNARPSAPAVAGAARTRTTFITSGPAAASMTPSGASLGPSPSRHAAPPPTHAPAPTRAAAPESVASPAARVDTAPSRAPAASALDWPPPSTASSTARATFPSAGMDAPVSATAQTTQTAQSSAEVSEAPPAMRAPPQATPSAPVANEPSSPPAYETFTLTDPPPAVDDDDMDAAPSSLEDAVMREISDRSLTPGPVHTSTAMRSIIEPSELRPRSSNPPPNDEEEARPLPSIPPDAIVPDTTSAELAQAPAYPEVAEGTLPLPMPVDRREARPSDEPTAHDATSDTEQVPGPEAAATPVAAAEGDGPYVSPFDLAQPASAPFDLTATKAAPAGPGAGDGAPNASEPVAARREDGASEARPASRSGGRTVAIVLLIAAAVGGALYFMAGNSGPASDGPPHAAPPSSAP